jgi:hypothetical protein
MSLVKFLTIFKNGKFYHLEFINLILIIEL